MGQIRPTKKYLAFADFYDFTRCAVRFYVEFDIAFDLIEKLFARFEVEIEPRVRARQHHHNEFRVVRDNAVRPERRIEQMLVLGDPGFQIGGRKQHISALGR
jgi:hypothetical protein